MDVTVLGAGRLGRAIAQTCALGGHDATLRDDEAHAVMDAVDAIESRLPAEAGSAAERIAATTGLDAAVADADVVVQTDPGEAAALQESFARIEEATDRETLIALSVPGVSVTAVAAGLRHPDRALGLRFRDPLESPLVEVIVADQTSREAGARTRSFVEGLERSPVVVRDAPGVVSTRAALALESEAMRIVADGVAGVTAIDDALELGFEHATGPLAQADRAGLGNRLETLERLAAELGDRFEPPDLLRERVAEGKTGVPAGEGFYVWENGTPVEPALPGPDVPVRENPADDPVDR